MSLPLRPPSVPAGDEVVAVLLAAELGERPRDPEEVREQAPGVWVSVSATTRLTWLFFVGQVFFVVWPKTCAVLPTGL